jgi:hypothetical protein
MIVTPDVRVIDAALCHGTHGAEENYAPATITEITDLPG